MTFVSSLLRRYFIIALLALAAYAPRPALAACASPAGNAGDIGYSSTQNLMLYCNGSAWIAMGANSAVSFGTLTTNNFCTATSSTAIACTTSSINLATQVTGTLPTGSLPSLSPANIWVGNGSSAATAVAMSGDCAISNAGAITCTKSGGVAFGALATAASPLPVANGGTGATSLTSNLIYKGAGTSAMAASSLTDTGSVVYTTETVGIGQASPVTMGSPGIQLASEMIIEPVVGNQLLLGLNMYYNGSAWKNIATDISAGIRMDTNLGGASQSGIGFYAQPSATAGSTLSPDGQERMVILTNGNVGIGTPTPGTLLHVNGAQGLLAKVSSPNNALFTYVDDATNTFTGSTNTVTLGASRTGAGTLPKLRLAGQGGMEFAVDGNSVRMMIDTSGNVGIGGAPGVPFQVSSATAGWVGRFLATGNGSTVYLAHGGGYGMYISPGTNANSSTYALDVVNGSGGTALYVDGAGNVGIGAAPGYTFQVVSSNGSWGAYIHNTVGNGLDVQTDGTTGQSASYGLATSSNAYGGLFQNTWGGHYCYVGTPNVAISCTDTVSDVRLKKDIVPMKPGEGLTSLMQLRPVHYRWKDPRLNRGEGPEFGFIAQEVEKVYPELVYEAPQAEGAVPMLPGRKSKGLYYQKFVVPAIMAIQELKSLFDSDHDAIAKLKADNDNLAAVHAADAKAIDELRHDVAELKRKNRLQ